MPDATVRTSIAADYFQGYSVVGLIAVIGVLFVAVAFGAGRLLRPVVPTPEKLLTYECGVDPVGEGWAHTQVRYYVYAFLYVIFAVDSIFLFPWATVFAAPVSAASRWWRCSSSSASSPSACSTHGRRASWNGRDERQADRAGGSRAARRVRRRCRGTAPAGPARPAGPRTHEGGPQLGPPLQPVGLQLRARLLRDRVHRRVDGPARLHPARRDPVRAGAAAGRPHDRLRHGDGQDGARGQAAVRADAGAEVRHLLRRVLELRRPLLGLLRGHQGRRPDHPRRRVRTGLPAPARGAAPGHPQAPGEDRPRVAGGAVRQRGPAVRERCSAVRERRQRCRSGRAVGRRAAQRAGRAAGARGAGAPSEAGGNGDGKPKGAGEQ